MILEIFKTFMEFFEFIYGSLILFILFHYLIDLWNANLSMYIFFFSWKKYKTIYILCYKIYFIGLFIDIKIKNNIYFFYYVIFINIKIKNIHNKIFIYISVRIQKYYKLIIGSIIHYFSKVFLLFLFFFLDFLSPSFCFRLLIKRKWLLLRIIF